MTVKSRGLRRYIRYNYIYSLYIIKSALAPICGGYVPQIEFIDGGLFQSLCLLIPSKYYLRGVTVNILQVDELYDVKER